MYRYRNSVVLRIVALVLAIVFVCPFNVCAADSRASAYLTSYNAYPYAAGGGTVQIWFNVKADDYMADIGSLSITVYECSTNSSNINDWDHVKSLTNGNTPSILGHNDYYYSSHVTVNGTVGKYYKAYICIYAGDGTNGDTRYLWTGAVKAT